MVIRKPQIGEYTHVVETPEADELVRTMLNAYVGRGKRPVKVDYSKIRPQGAPIKTFGGIAPGPGPLMECIDNIDRILAPRDGHPISSSDITDLMNVIGKCVVSGGVRRTAELALGSPDDQEYLQLKDHKKHPDQLKAWRWASNNSVIAREGMNYLEAGTQTSLNGEPGYFWLENARAYGRLKDGVTNVDAKVAGTNPCAEQSLESYEICNLVETFPSRHETLEEYLRTLKFAYLYAKTVTLIPHQRTHQRHHAAQPAHRSV